jgi:hypothetical protein
MMKWIDQDSKKIIKEINNLNIKNKIKKSKLLKDLFFEIINYFEILDIFKNKNKINFEESVINTSKLQQDPFIAPKIKQHILKEYRYSYKINYTFKISNNLCSICMNYATIRKITVKDKKIISGLLMRIEIIKRYFNNVNNLTLYIYPTKFKKHFNKGVLGLFEINNGSRSNYSDTDDMILLWRKEELNKVLIHEVIHSVSYDKFIYDTDYVDNKIKTVLNILVHISGNEIITELFANILNSMINIIEDNTIHNHISNKKLYNNYLKIYNYELRFGLLQTAKILHHNGYNNMEQLERNNIHTKVFLQKTNIFSYYILKTALLNNLDKYLNIHLHIMLHLKKEYTTRSLNNIRDMILDLIFISSKDMYKNVNKIMKLVQIKTLSKSLRMSIL